MSMQGEGLPAAGFPLVTRVVSNPLFPDEDAGVDVPITWAIKQPHPLVPKATVVRMFVTANGVEIYAVLADGQNGIRNLIPMLSVRLVEEVMPMPVFVAELESAELGDEDDEDDEDDEPSAVQHARLVPVSQAAPDTSAS